MIATLDGLRSLLLGPHHTAQDDVPNELGCPWGLLVMALDVETSICWTLPELEGISRFMYLRTSTSSLLHDSEND